MDSYTPRSNGNTPRDDRFYTPRVHSSYSSGDEQWITPRISLNGEYKGYSDSEFVTPRGHTPRDIHDNNISYDKANIGYSTELGEIHEFDDDMIAVNMMAGVTDDDVEDIFSYARHGRCDDMERLLDRGIPINIRDKYGNTLLTIACQNGNKRIAKAVLRRGADINARNFKGNTPLHYCFHYGYGDSLGQYLISKGADQYARNNEGRICWDGI